MRHVAVQQRAGSSLLFIAITLLTLGVLVAAGAEASVQTQAALVIPDRTAFEIDDPTESLAANAYFAAGDAAPATVAFTGRISVGELTLEGDFTLTKVDDPAFDHQVEVANLTVSEGSPLTGGVVVDSITSGTFEWGDSGFAGTAAGGAAVAFTGDRNDPDSTADDLGLEVSPASFFLLLNTDMTYVYDFAGSGELRGADDLSLTGSLVGQANSTGLQFTETVTIDGGTRLIDVPADVRSLSVNDGVIASSLGEMAGDFRFASGATPPSDEIGLLIAGESVETRLGTPAGAQLVVGNADLAALLLADGSHALQGAGAATFEGVAADREPTITGQVAFEENTTGASLLHTFSVGGISRSLNLPADANRFFGPGLSFEILDRGVEADFEFSQAAPDEVTIEIANGLFALGDGTNNLVSIENIAGSYTLTTGGLTGSAAGEAIVSPEDVDISGALTLEIDTTATTPHVWVSGIGAALAVDGQVITGDFSIEEITTGGGTSFVLIDVSSGELRLGDGLDDLVTATGVGGGLLLSVDGVATDLSATFSVAPGLPTPVAAGTARLQLNTTNEAVREVFVVSGSPVLLDLPAGPFLGIYVVDGSFRFGPVILNGDFFLDPITLGASQAVRWTVSEASLDTGVLGMTNGEGAFVTVSDGTAGSVYGDGTAAETPFVGFRFNNTGRAVDETIEFEGVPYEIQFSAAEGDLVSVFAIVVGPLITIESPIDGASVALNTPVVVSFGCEQNGPYIVVSCHATVDDDDFGDGEQIDTSEPGPVVVTVRARDSAGDVATKTVTFTVLPDLAKPTILITTPAAGSNVFPGTSVKAEYACSDTGGSGVETCVGSVNGVPIASGASIDTGTVGTYTLAVVATDGAGNRTESSVVLTVKRARPGDDQVARLYQAALGRPADAGGLAFWTAKYRAGATLSAIATEMLGSAEARARYGSDLSDEDFVRALYTNALGRLADENGLAFWVRRLATMSRGDLLVSFSESPENIAQTGTTQPLTSASSKIVRLYQAAFGRRPDASGQAFWESVFPSQLTLHAVAELFLGSPEAISLYGERPTDEEFVDALYQNVLGRPGESSGRAFWLDRLDAGSSRPSVLVFFSESIENLERTGTRP